MAYKLEVGRYFFPVTTPTPLTVDTTLRFVQTTSDHTYISLRASLLKYVWRKEWWHRCYIFAQKSVKLSYQRFLDVERKSTKTT